MDPVIPIARATASRDLLLDWGYNVEWHDYDAALAVPGRSRAHQRVAQACCVIFLIKIC
jgi:predicted esterase